MSSRRALAAETEKLRAALLTSISHDLRTPLASVLGSATSLRNYRHTLDDAAQDELIGTIQEEAERLNRFIANLLDMTRLEAGAVQPQSRPDRYRRCRRQRARPGGKGAGPASRRRSS